MPEVPIPAYTTFAKLKANSAFKAAAAQAEKLKREIAERETKLDEIKQVLEPLLLAAGVEENQTVLFGTTQFRVCDQSGGFKLNEAKLIKAGVLKAVIERCKTPNKRKHYVSVKLASEEGDE